VNIKTLEGINESNKAHAVNFLSVAIALIKKDIITEETERFVMNSASIRMGFTPEGINESNKAIT